MKTGDLDLRYLSRNDVVLLRDELEYYQLELPPSMLQGSWEDLPRESNLVMFDQNMVVAKARRSGDWSFSAAIGTVPNPRSFTVKLHKDGGVMIGLIARGAFFHSSTSPNHLRGWFINCSNGNVHHPEATSSGEAYLCRPISAPSEVQVVLDESEGTVSFWLDGRQAGRSLKLKTGGEALYAAVEFFQDGIVSLEAMAA